MSSIEISRAGQNPGRILKNNSFQSVRKRAATGANRIKPDAFMMTNPSTLFDANALTNSAIIGP